MNVGASNIGEGPGATEVMILRNCSRTIVTLDVIFAGFLRMKMHLVVQGD